MKRWSASAAAAIRETGRAYLQPLISGREGLQRGLQKIWPGAGRVPANVLFAALLSVVAFASGWVIRTGRQENVRIYRTAHGAIEHVPLTDGSLVQLGPLSQLNVQFIDGVRSIALVRGEAYFEVKHDASRPVQVRVGDNVVRVLGTKFDVRALPDGEVSVMVREGVVTVFQQLQGAAPARVPQNASRVGAGQLALVKDGETQVRTATEVVEARLAWREGFFVFVDDDLATVVEEINRFSARRIVIDDPSISGIRFSGNWAHGKEYSLLEALRQVFGIQYRLGARAGTQEIHLYRDVP